MKVKVYVKVESYEDIEVLNEQDFQKMKAEGIKTLIDDDTEFAEWLNDNFTPIEVYTSTDRDILNAWEECCRKVWDCNNEDEWTPFTIEV